jgi:dual specificity MAP kinase phosphatase
VFERDQPHLVAVNAKGRDVNRIDFFAREKEEMRELTKASEIAEGVWVCWHFFKRIHFAKLLCIAR